MVHHACAMHVVHHASDPPCMVLQDSPRFPKIPLSDLYAGRVGRLGPPGPYGPCPAGPTLAVSLADSV